jgi:acyl-CoA synthetase
VAAAPNLADRMLAAIVAAHADAMPERPALIADGQTTSWRQYRDRSDTLAAIMVDCGIARGERVALLLPDGHEVHVALLACEKAGVIAVSLSARAGEAEIEHLIHVSGASALISEADYRGAPTNELFTRLRQTCRTLERHLTLNGPAGDVVLVDGATAFPTLDAAKRTELEHRRFAPDELFLLNATSGSSGMPKCVAQSQGRWLHWAKYADDAAVLTPDDIFLCAVPSSAGFGLWSGHFIPALLGAPTVLLPKFTVAGMLAAIAAHKVTVLSAVSTQLVMTMAAPESARAGIGSLRVLFTGGEAVPYDKAAAFEDATGATVLQFYGSNECGALSYTSIRDTRERRLRTAGRIIPDMQVRLLDERTGESLPPPGRGQPVCRGSSNSLGYFNNDDANLELYAPNGAMKIGDIVTIDADGYLTVVGRVGDFIIRGGKNISAAAVDEAVLKHPAVAMAASVAMPDPIFGEKVCAYITLKPGGTLTLAALTAFLEAQGVSRDWLPEHLIVLDEMPMVSGGKIAKRILRDDIRQR